MNLIELLDKTLIESGGKRSGNNKTYFFIKPTLRIMDKDSGYKYTVSKVKVEPEILIQCYRHSLSGDDIKIIEIPWDKYKKNYVRV